MTKEQKKEELFKIVSRAREDCEADFSCQYKGGKEERFCRVTSRLDCKGCKDYSIGIWDFFAKCYDLLRKKDEEIVELRLGKEKNNGRK